MTVEFTDEDIQELVKSELLKTKLSTQIDGVILLENPNNPSIGIAQTLLRLVNIFGEQIKESIIVILSQAYSVRDIPEAID